MTKLVSVQFQNFQLYGSVPTKVDFSTPGTTIIGGKNGTGKSTIINAISYGLYDKPVSDISKDGLINNINKKNMEVIVEFEKGGKTYKIRRYRKMKGNGVEVWEDENDITPDSISNANAVIEGILDMPHDLFVRVIIFSAINTQFLNLPMRNQADMLEELLDLKMLSDKAAVLKDHIKETNRSVEIEDNNIEQANVDCHKFAGQYQRATDRVEDWDTNHKDKVNNTKNTIKELQKINIVDQIKFEKESEQLEKTIEEVERDLQTYKTERKTEESVVVELNNAIKKSENWEHTNTKNIEDTAKAVKLYEEMDIDAQLALIDQLEKLEQESFTLLTEIKTVRGGIDEFNKTIDKNEQELTHLEDNTCPYCKQHFEDTKEQIKLCKINIKTTKASLKKLSAADTELATQKIDIESAEDAIKSKIEYSKNDLHLAQTDSIKVTEQLENAKVAVNEWTHTIELLEKKSNPKKIKKLNQQVDESTTHIQTLLDQADTISEKMTMSSAEIKEHNNKIIGLETRLSDLQDESNPMMDPLNELTDEKYTYDDSLTFVEVIKRCKTPITDESVFITGTDRSDHLHKLAEHQQFLLKLLTNKNSFIRKTMLNQTIPFLNNQLDGYLKTMGLPHSVTFTPKMEVNISRLGNTLQYGNLSNGQACRVNLALSFAFRDVLQYLHDPINVLVLDEVLDVGLDSEGIQNAANMIKQKAEHDQASIFVISHRDELDNTFNKRIDIQIKDGFSQIL